MPLSRRDLLKGLGALVVSFSSSPLLSAQGGDANTGTHGSHVDPAELDSWLAIGSDGSITAFTGKCDLGQGILTAQTQLVAEELCVALARVTLIQCDTAITPDQGSTSGSQSTPSNFNQENLALAAATAREALLALAAQQLGIPVEQLTLADGIVSTPAGKRTTYQELIGNRRFHLPLDKAAQRRKPAEWTVLGKPIPALDHPALMTGSFEYVHYVRVPGMLHGRVVRPPSMGAHLLSVDRHSVAYIPGLIQVVVRQNFVGVVAETQHAAITAARQLVTRWQPGRTLPPHGSFHAWLGQQPSRDELSVDSGDLAVTLPQGNPVHARYTYPFQMHGSVGTSCAVADVHPDGATLWSATQSVYPTRDVTAMLLRLPKDQVRVIYKRGSGCYGLNGADAVSFDAAMLSQAVGRPVRLQYSREDEMLWENLGSATVVEHRAALSSDGRILAWDREDWVAERGGRPGYDRPGNVISGMLVGYDPDPIVPAPAKPPHGKLRNGSNTVPPYLAGCIDGQCGGAGTIRSERVLTHTVMAPFFSGPLRAPLRIQNTFATEGFMDELAFAAGADPADFRLRHIADPRLIAVVRAALDAAHWQPRATPARLRAQDGLVAGRGVACVAYEGQNGYAAMVAEIAVDLRTGQVRPQRYTVAIDCGPVSNPDGLRNQIEGGVLQGSSRALLEEVTWDRGRITSTDWITYNSLRLDLEPPVIESVIVAPPGVRATGAGETAICVTPAALGNALFDATGLRLREVPFTPGRILAALRQHHGLAPQKGEA